MGCTLGALGGFCGSGAGGIEGLWMGEAEGLPVYCVGVGRGCWRGVLVGQSAAVWRCGRATVEMVRSSSHQLKRSRILEIVWSWALLVVEGALVMALEMALRLWTIVLASVTVGINLLPLRARMGSLLVSSV